MTAAAVRPVLVVCGVAGVGKTTAGQQVAALLGVPFADADAYHAPEAVARMQRGQPLTDAARAPWLDRLAEVLARWHADATGGVLACSALTPLYRARLARAAPPVQFVLLTATANTLRQRLAARTGHFFPPALLASQLATLDAAGIPTVSTDARPPEAVAAAVVALVTA